MTENKAVKVLAVRGPAINAFVKEYKQLGTTVSISEAAKLAEEAIDLPSPLLLNHDDDCKFRTGAEQGSPDPQSCRITTTG